MFIIHKIYLEINRLDIYYAYLIILSNPVLSIVRFVEFSFITFNSTYQIE